jgi:mRNA interferase MazF
MSSLVRGRIYRFRLLGIEGEKYFVVVSNNSRNRALPSVVGVRLTTSRKPSLPSIVEIPSSEVLAGGRAICDDIYELFDDEMTADIGALSPDVMSAVDGGLKAALALA